MNGKRKRDAGHADSAAAIGPKNAERIDRVLVLLARRGKPFTSDDVRTHLTTSELRALTLHPSALAAKLTQACRAKIIRKTKDTEPSRRESRRGAHNAVYVRGRAA